MAKYAGKAGKVYLSITGAGAATTIVGLNEWSLNMNADRFEVSEFGASNKAKVQGLPDVAGTLSGFWDDTDDNLYDGSKSTSGVKLYLYPSTTAATKYWYGPAWVDFSVNVSVGGAATVSGSFEANGDWGQM